MTRPRILVVQHQHDCPPAWFGTWIAEAGVALDVRRPYAGEALPEDLTGHDALLVLGGSMNATDETATLWLAPTKDLVRAAAGTGVPVLGICLGHQIVADALGGTVGQNPLGTQRAILGVGWTAAGARDAVFGACPPRAAHWNDDVVTALPDGAVVLGSAPGGEVQVARFTDRIWGIQAHPEIDEVVLGDWIADAGAGHDLLPALLAERDALLESWKPVAAAFARTMFP